MGLSANCSSPPWVSPVGAVRVETADIEYVALQGVLTGRGEPGYRQAQLQPPGCSLILNLGIKQ